MNQNLEIIKTKGLIFAVRYTQRSDFESIVDTLYSNQICVFNKKKLEQIKVLHQRVSSGKCFYIDEIFRVFGLDGLNEINIYKGIKQRILTTYKEHISEIFKKTIKTINLNLNKINIPSLTYNIFYSLQEFSERNPNFVQKNWFCGLMNIHTAKTIKPIFESYTTSAPSSKLDTNFCLEKLFNILDVILASLQSSSTIDYIDSVMCTLQKWYFQESQKNYDFLAFQPSSFDDLRDFIANFIIDNPLSCYIVENESNLKICDKDKVIAEANNILMISDNHLSQISTVAEVKATLSRFINTNQCLKTHETCNYECFEIAYPVYQMLCSSQNLGIILRYAKNNPSALTHILTINNANGEPSTIISTLIRPYIAKFIRSRRSLDKLDKAG